jgi:hypothetical protein
MAINALYESSATISTTEYSLPNASTTLTPKTDDGVFQLFLDVSALLAADQYELKIYEKVQAAGSQRLVDTWIFDGPQARPHWVSPSLIFMHGWDITLKKISGTDRAIAWSIRQVA